MPRVLVLIVLSVVAALVLVGCSRTEEDPIRTAAEAISEIADSGERVAAAQAFLKDHPTADPEILGQVATDLLYAVRQNRGYEATIAAADSMLAEGLPDYARFVVEGFQTSDLLRTETPENIVRADEISRRLLRENIDHPYGYTYMASAWLRTVDSDEHHADPWLALDLALRGSEKAEDGWTDYADMMLGRAYGTVFGVVEERRGGEAIPAVADSLLAVTESADGAAHIRSALYNAAVEDDPAAAVAIAEDVESRMGEMTGGGVLNSMAFDLAERELAPGLAVSLAERALELTSGKWDSIYVLDTVGWAHHKAGNAEQAASYLTQALDLMDEDPSFGDEMVQHLLAVYDAAGDLDGSIDLLIRVAARSLDEGAIAALETKLTTRDGSADALNRLLEDSRYAGVEAAPAFTLPNRSGEMVALADLGGRVSLLCFWSYG